MLRSYVQPDYAYSFPITITRDRYSSGIDADVRTNQYGQGRISINGQEIPINLAGKGLSKARKKARGIAYWFITHGADTESRKIFNKLVPYQKRASQRARKKLRHASRRSSPSFSYDSWRD